MNQYLLCGTESFDIVEANTKAQAIESYRMNGFGVTVAFTVEQVAKLLTDRWYATSFKNESIRKYASMVNGNIRIVEGRMTY
jgi:hypothetical protein